MPLLSQSARCGPRLMSHILKVELHRAQEITGWRDQKGAEPEGLVSAFEQYGYEAKFIQNTSLEECEIFLKTNRRRKPHVILDYWDWFFGTLDGHYAELTGFNAQGDPILLNLDFEDTTSQGFVTLPRNIFLLFWFDYRIDSTELIKRGAIFAKRAVR